MHGGVVGRGDELRLIDAMLASDVPGGCSLTLEGGPGVGKSTLFDHGVASARRAGGHVLVARPTCVESRLTYACLGDLLRGLDGERMELAPPRRRALEVALLEAFAGDDPVDLLAVPVAVTALLELLARGRPVVVAIDDAQWADAASASTLRFAARRLADVPIRWLVTRRSSAAEGGFGTDVPDYHRSTRRVVSGMNLAELHRLVDDKLGVRLSRMLLVRVAQVSGGNPLHAIELARHVTATSAAADRMTDLGVPPSLRQLMCSRLDVLPDPVRRIVAVTALTAHPSVALLARVERLSAATVRRRVKAAVDAGVLRLSDEIEFTHPLLAAAAIDEISSAERARLHGRLFKEVASSDERARHHALATTGPDRDLADELEAAADQARERGAPIAAAELVALAIERTPASRPADSQRRLLAAADLAFQAGDTERAKAVLIDLDEAADLDIRAHALVLLARVSWLAGSHRDVEAFGERALAAARSPLARAEVKIVLANLSRNDRVWGDRHANDAVAILEGLGSVAAADARTRALVAVLDVAVDLGRPLQTAVLDQALAAAPKVGPGRVADTARYYLGTILLQYDDLDRARELLLACSAAAHNRGDDGSLPAVWDQLSQLELLAGNWREARRYAERQIAAADMNDQPLERLWGFETCALLDVREGADGAQRRAADVLAQARASGDPMLTAFALRTDAEASRSIGDLASAARALREVDEIALSIHVHCPNAFRHAGELVDVLVEIGLINDAETRARSFAAAAHDGELPSSIAVSARAEAVVSARQGRLHVALEQAEESVVTGRTLGMPFELGRSLLILASVQR